MHNLRIYYYTPEIVPIYDSLYKYKNRGKLMWGKIYNVQFMKHLFADFSKI